MNVSLHWDEATDTNAAGTNYTSNGKNRMLTLYNGWIKSLRPLGRTELIYSCIIELPYDKITNDFTFLKTPAGRELERIIELWQIAQTCSWKL